MLNGAIERLNDITKCQYIPNDCYGYSQLAMKLPETSGAISSIYAAQGCTKKELYYQIHFYLDLIGKESKKENHQKWLARKAVANAIARGKIKYGSCVICGSIINIHGHHEDYTKPLDITWLCHQHHVEKHGMIMGGVGL